MTTLGHALGCLFWLVAAPVLFLLATVFPGPMLVVGLSLIGYALWTGTEALR